MSNPVAVYRRELRLILATLYPSASDARRFSVDIGLRVERVNFNGTALNIWDDILREVARTDPSYSTVLTLARNEYPNNSGLAGLAAPIDKSSSRRVQKRINKTVAVFTVVSVGIVTGYIGLRLNKPHCQQGTQLIHGGRFSMGASDGIGEPDEHPRHDVAVGDFCIDLTEVTESAFEIFIAAGYPRARSIQYPTSSGNVTEDLWFGPNILTHAGTSRGCNLRGATVGEPTSQPINCVDWFTAVSYCAWRGGRLPTEAEWEYAAGGARGWLFTWGNTAVDLPTNACASISSSLEGTCGVRDSSAGLFGLFGMSGNVWEWVLDAYGQYAPVQGVSEEPNHGTPSSTRVYRGGSWGHGNVIDLRRTNRARSDPSYKSADLGFRCVFPLNYSRFSGN